MSVATSIEVPTVARNTPIPVLGLAIAWAWCLAAGGSLLIMHVLRVDSYTLWQVRVPAALLSAVLATVVPVLLSPIPALFRKRAISFFIPAAILWVLLSVFELS